MSSTEAARLLARPWRRRLEKLRNRHFLLLDAAALSVTPFLALTLRLDRVSAVAPYIPDLCRYTVAALGLRIALFYVFGLYRRYWRYATVDELIQIVSANLIALVVVAAVYYQSMSVGLLSNSNPRSLPLIDGILAMLLVGGSRLSSRLATRAFREPPREDATRVLVVGAGLAGQMLVRELQSRPESKLRPVGYVDDDPEKQNARILNVPVLGGREELAAILKGHRIREVIIAMPSAPGKVVREILRACEEAGVPAHAVPTVSEILQGKVSVSQLRTVQIEDLLRRETVATDAQSVRRSLRGRRVLVTGGGGSIGSELCRQILECEPEELVLLGHGENSVFEIHNEILALQAKRARLTDRPHSSVRSIIADIRFEDRIGSIVADVQPDVIFHAAAHKHVPLMEANPSEAITNNVLGTRNVVAAARACGVNRFVMISTDKAVNPTSVMGASKRVAELLVLKAARETGRPFVAVRFGNVLGSRGSVVPTFKRQIAQGGPVTVSHPEMRRYFMTIPEAVQLVLQAQVLGAGGEIFMLDMGEPVRILDLAQDLIELSGLELGQDIDIRFTGLRPGEKLFEELYVKGEKYQPTVHDKIMIAANASAFIPENLADAVRNVEQIIGSHDDRAVISWLQAMVPEFTPDPRRWADTTFEEGGVAAVAPETQRNYGRGELHAVLERP